MANKNTASLQEAANFHQAAMNHADHAELARLRGDAKQALDFLRQALDYERIAAECMRDRLDMEPTRSVLHRSAAALAVACGEYGEAERLIAAGLAGVPPPEIADELRSLRDQIKAST